MFNICNYHSLFAPNMIPFPFFSINFAITSPLGNIMLINRRRKVKQNHILLIIAALFFVTSAVAQRRESDKQVMSEDSVTLIIASYVDSLELYKARLDSLERTNDSLTTIQTNIASSKYYRLFSPLTYDPKVTGRLIDSNAEQSNNIVDEQIDALLLKAYSEHPELIETTMKRLHQSAESGKIEQKAPVRRKIEVVKEVQPVKELGVPEQDEVRLFVAKPNFWRFSGDYNLQFFQNFVSDNWYKSGESNLSMLGNVKLQAHYNNKQKVKFENTLEMKLGLQTSQSDTIHQYKTSQDQLRYTGKLALHAIKRWDYTTQVIATTQFMRGYKSNDKKTYSDFLSPLEVNLSLGMDYNVDAFKKKLTGSVHLAPLAYNLKYVDRLDLSKRYGLEEGDHTLHDFGSQFTITLTWKPSEMIKWDSRLYGYTTYHRGVLEWENTVSVKVSKYITTNLYFYPRFDDSAKRAEGWDYWQLKEYLSFGFSYSM